MTTSLNSTIPARDLGYQLMHFLRKRINIGVTGGLVTTVVTPLGLTLPANAAVTSASGVWVTVDLGGTTNTLDIGYAADTLGTEDINAYMSTGALPITTGGWVAMDEIAATGFTARPRTVDAALTATFTGTATTGQIDIVVGYCLFS